MTEATTETVIWETGGPYPPEGIYELTLSDGRIMIRPMSPDWVWDDTFGGAKIDVAKWISEIEVAP